jgi:hypothetical protein
MILLRFGILAHLRPWAANRAFRGFGPACGVACFATPTIPCAANGISHLFAPEAEVLEAAFLRAGIAFGNSLVIAGDRFAKTTLTKLLRNFSGLLSRPF